MTNEDIIFTAGLFLGEGTLSVRAMKNGNGHTGIVSVNQLDREPLERLQKLWGGRVSVHKANGKPSNWQWYRSGKKALPCLEAILPVMRNWSAWCAERIEKFVKFYAIDGADWRARSTIVQWFNTCVEDHKEACRAELKAWYEEVQNGIRL